MRIGSLFSGGGGGDLGFRNAGHEIVFGCEIDPKARSVLRYHHPTIPIYNDVREVTRERLESDGIALPELIMGGSPCQDLSVAGNRAGLGGERSGLFHEQCRIATELSSPWVCWENVAGAFSSNKGLDFAAVLGGLTGHTPTVPHGGWKTGGICIGPDRIAVWRLLDAQNFGVPQRRRRVFVVAGPRTLARRVVQVLFESESIRRDTPKSRKTWKDVAADTAGGSTANRPTNFPLVDVIGTLSPGAHGNGARTVNGQDAYTGQLVPVQMWSGSAQQENIAAPLLHGSGGPRTTDIDGGTWVVHNDNPQSLHENQRGEIRLSEIANSLTVGGGKMGQGFPAVMHEPFVAFDSTWSGQYDMNNDGTTSPTLKVGGTTGGNPPAIATQGNPTIVRRLTPLECERLMGWPDNYTANGIDDEGTTVDLATTNRYRICGNGIVSNVTEWIGERLP